MNKFSKKLGHHGFTIIEIMVALMLVVLIFTIIPLGSEDQQHSKLEETIADFDRAIKFSINESILRNSITRIMIDLEANPIEYSVEYGTSSNIILPTLQDEARLSIKEREQQQKIQQSLDSQFSKVDEFSTKSKVLPEGISIIGLASSYLPDIKRDGKLAIYFYPTGEKDNTIIFFATEKELSWLDIPPFESITYVDYYTFSESELVNLENSQDNKMKEVYDQWIKD